MKDRVEPGAGIGVPEHLRAQGGSIETAARPEGRISEGRRDLPEPWRPRLDDLSGEDIGVDDREPRAPKRLATLLFPEPIPPVSPNTRKVTPGFFSRAGPGHRESLVAIR